MRATSVLRHSPWDGTLVALALLHGAALVFIFMRPFWAALLIRPLDAVPAIVLIALGLWWNANTISHNFIHLPFFRSRRMNDLFSFYLTLLLGFPQHLWRARHLAHHAGKPGRQAKNDAPTTWTGRILIEAGLVLALWAALAVLVPRLFFLVYLPGYLIGLALCQLHGYFEHAHGTTSHYGRIYNAVFFNDGYHLEHHAKPSAHWTRLRPLSSRLRPSGFGAASSARASSWPPVLRWLDEVPAALDLLERCVLRSSVLQSMVLGPHQSAIARSLVGLSEIKSVAIIGGGLFPRTAIIMQRLLPAAAITIVDRSPESLKSAQRFLDTAVTTIERDCDASHAFDADLVIVPLAFVGDRNAFYENPPAAVVMVHEWIWRRRGEGTCVSWWLLKRVNVVKAVHRERRAA